MLPLPLAVAASARLEGPRTTAALRDVVARLSGLIVRSQPGQPSEQLGLFHLSLAEEYLLRRDPDVQFPVDPIDGHAALAAALRELAPVEEHDPGDPLHRYALRAEPDHRWAGRDSTGVLASSSTAVPWTGRGTSRNAGTAGRPLFEALLARSTPTP